MYHLLTNAPVASSRRTREASEDTEETHVPSTMIFVGKSEKAELLSKMLLELGISNAALHSMLSQPQRLESLSRFRARSVPLLITTDLGSRGLDVPDVEMVINWDLPREWRDYIHRVGRTARNGKPGLAVSFVGERDIDLLKNIEDVINVRMEELPFHEDTVLNKLNSVMTAKRMASMHLHDTHFGQRTKRNKAKAAMRIEQDSHRSKHSTRLHNKHK